MHIRLWMLPILSKLAGVSVAGLQQTRLFMHRPHTHIAALAASWWKEWCRINLGEDFAEIVTVLGCLQLARDAWLGGVLALDSSGYVIFERENQDQQGDACVDCRQS
jgi:hypothetical protein